MTPTFFQQHRRQMHLLHHRPHDDPASPYRHIDLIRCERYSKPTWNTRFWDRALLKAIRQCRLRTTPSSSDANPVG